MDCHRIPPPFPKKNTGLPTLLKGLDNDHVELLSASDICPREVFRASSTTAAYWAVRWAAHCHSIKKAMALQITGWKSRQKGDI
jgi:hypothetical protein